jgi:hypothetical protein
MSGIFRLRLNCTTKAVTQTSDTSYSQPSRVVGAKVRLVRIRLRKRPVKGKYRDRSRRYFTEFIRSKVWQLPNLPQKSLRQFLTPPFEKGGYRGISHQVTLSSASGSSNHSGRKRRFASRQFKNAECFRIPKNSIISVSVCI